MKRIYVVFFLLVFSIPVLMGINVWRSNECGIIKKNMRHLERTQEDSVEENKTVANEIAGLLTVAKVENDAKEKLGFKRIRPENVMLIIMGGKGNGN